MPVYKRRNTSGKIVWFYKFQPPGAARNVLPIREFGFATKQAAVDAEVVRRTEEQKKYEMAKSGATGVAAAMPKTLAMLLDEFLKQHAEENLAPKTVERYREMVTYLAPELLAMNMTEITPLHCSREWTRLLKSGGHTRKTKAPRPMKPKTVRNIAGVVSSAFLRAIKWGLATVNPVTHSDLPKVRKRAGMALLPSEQDVLIGCANGPWCLPPFLEMSSATGARRGEVLALRWSDVKGATVFVDRSLCQTRAGLVFKSTKTEEPRKVELPPSMLACLEAHRQRQDEFRRQFGADYRSDLDLIFANPDGTPLRPNSVSATVSRLCQRLGLPKGASLHVLRHSHASLLLEKGVDIATVSERLGHSSVRTTADIYSHAIRGKDHAAAQTWDDIMQRTRAEKPAGIN
jgi:integrase